MKCEFCGEINEYGAHFCKKCGAEIGKVQNGAAGILGDKAVAKTKDLAKNLKSKLSKKVLIIIGVCVVALIAIIIAINAFLPGKYTYPKNTISFLYDSEFEQTSVLVDTKLLSTTIDGSVYSTQNNFDGDVCAVLSSDDTLYYITSSTVQSIADEVGYFALSSQGDAVAYIDSDATLYIYSADDSKKTKVEDEVEDSYVVISPDGKTVAYLIDDDESKLYVYTNGKSTLVGKELAAIAVSNSGKYIYSYREENEALYVSELGGDKNKLAADVDTDYFILNKDHTEIIFTADSKSYISIKGGDKEKIGSSSSLTPLFPAKTLYVYRLYCVYSCPVSELLDNVFEDYYNDNLYNLYYINNEYESDKLASSISSACIDDEGSYIFYVKSSDLYKASVNDSSNSEKLVDDVSSFVISSDGKYVYYINTDDELWCKKGNSDAKKLADDVYSIIMTDDNIALFLTDYSSYNGILYSCSNGKDKNKISDDVYSVYATATAAYYYANYDSSKCIYDVYASNGNANFSCIAEEINHYEY